MAKPVFDRIEVVPKDPERPEEEQKFNLHLKQVTMHLQTRTQEDIDAEILRLQDKIEELNGLKVICADALKKYEEVSRGR